MEGYWSKLVRTEWVSHNDTTFRIDFQFTPFENVIIASPLRILLLLSIAPSLIFSQASLDEKITREWEEERLNYIFFDLDRITDFDIRYNESILPKTRYSYSFVETPLRQILKIVLDKDQLQYYEYTPGKLAIAPQKVMNIEHKSAEKQEPVIAPKTKETLMQIGQEIKSSREQAIVLGILLDNQFFEPIANALIYNETTEDFTTSDAEGKFVLVFNPGIYLLHITSLSHENVSHQIQVLGSDPWRVELQAKAYYIEEVIISAKAQDYVV